MLLSIYIQCMNPSMKGPPPIRTLKLHNTPQSIQNFSLNKVNDVQRWVTFLKRYNIMYHLQSGKEKRYIRCIFQVRLGKDQESHIWKMSPTGCGNTCLKLNRKGEFSKKYMKNKQIHIMERKRWFIIFRECLKL